MADDFTLNWLRDRMHHAAQQEDYEQAARLRDRIRQLEQDSAVHVASHQTAAQVGGEPHRELHEHKPGREWIGKGPIPFSDPHVTAVYHRHYSAFHEEMRPVIETILCAKLQRLFNEIWSAHAMRKQILRVVDHRNHTEEYHYKGRMVLLVNTGTWPWTIHPAS